MDARLTREALNHHRMADDMVALVDHPSAACPLVGYRDGVIALCPVLR